eukprot:1865228-Heterocapsa_arctica.AAC.1
MLARPHTRSAPSGFPPLAAVAARRPLVRRSAAGRSPGCTPPIHASASACATPCPLPPDCPPLPA